MTLSEIKSAISIEPFYEELNGSGILYCADCLSVLKMLPDKCVDLVLTDPPYANAGMNYDNYNDKDIKKVNKLVFDFLEIAERKAKIIIFPSGRFLTEIALYQKKPPKWRLCWYKGAVGARCPVGFNDWEMMMVYGDNIYVKQHDYFTVINNEKMGNYGHPCPKPIKWATWLIHRFCPPNGIVLDPFLGSGTTAVAAKELGRRFIGIEISPAYLEICKKRLAQGILL